jgi:hypothetical protein
MPPVQDHDKGQSPAQDLDLDKDQDWDPDKESDQESDQESDMNQDQVLGPDPDQDMN